MEGRPRAVALDAGRGALDALAGAGQQVVALVGGLAVALDDVVDGDVAPAALLAVHDLDADLLALQVAHVPGVPAQVLGVARRARAARGGADDLAADEQVDARLARVVSAADQEIYAGSPDRSGSRR